MNTNVNKDQLGYAHPRPQLTRSWESLNGAWDFAIDKDAALTQPASVVFDRTITVPFAPETQMSGINDTSAYKAVWYRRQVKTPSLTANERLLLHFGAVDFAATVWVNDREVVRHEGGYTPFFADITDAIDSASAMQTIVVRAFDNPSDLEQNRGKQHWGKGEGIWYWRTTGIWQTVWMEVVPSVRIAHLDWGHCSLDWERLKQFQIEVNAEFDGVLPDGVMLDVALTCNGRTLAREAFALTDEDRALSRVSHTIALRQLQRRIQIPDAWHDELQEWLLWSPEHPNLIEANVVLRTADGAALDSAGSYTALRSFEARGNKLFLNDREIKLRLALDQGYWAESGMTAPSDEALERDVVIARSVFNGVRKHNKLEDPRWLYWADVHGLLVWEELPSAYMFSPRAAARSSRLWQEAIRRDRSHPCIIAWVPINESWGVPQLEGDSIEALRQRQFQQQMYYETKTLTDGGVVIGNDGWEMIISDIVAIHDYDHDPERMRKRYADDEPSRVHLFAHERPGGRAICVGVERLDGPMGLTEFGGIKLSEDPSSWGYSVARNAAELRDKFAQLMGVVRNLDAIVVFCYTELFDAYWEANGLFTMDREPKFEVADMRAAVWG